MSDTNPGPAITSNPNSVAVLTPTNAPSDSNPQGSNDLRLLGSARGISVATAGDVAIINILNSSLYAPATIVTSNALVSGVSGTIATATVGVYTAASAGGTAVLTKAALTGQTTSAFAYVRASSTPSTAETVQQLYVNVGTTVAGGTCDLFVYGYDLS